MINGTDRTLSRRELDDIEQHVAQCPSCSRFREDLNRIRNGLKAPPCHEPSEELLTTTRALCYAKIEAMGVSGTGALTGDRSRPVPKVIWAAVVTLIVLTGIIVISLLPELEIEEPLSLKTILAFTLIVQNAAMLFFAPLLIQKLRFPKKGFDSNGYDNFVV